RFLPTARRAGGAGALRASAMDGLETCYANCASRRGGWRVAPVSEKNASGASAICSLRSFIWRVAHLHSSSRALRR
ncbi:hypothetical protein A2U01_0100626, partial [Trifolium medium]|nr:hypothetical protein [Trifolium medium]